MSQERWKKYHEKLLSFFFVEIVVFYSIQWLVMILLSDVATWVIFHLLAYPLSKVLDFIIIIL